MPLLKLVDLTTYYCIAGVRKLSQAYTLSSKGILKTADWEPGKSEVDDGDTPWVLGTRRKRSTERNWGAMKIKLGINNMLLGKTQRNPIYFSFSAFQILIK